MTWTDDGVFKPLERYAKRADQQYAVGEVYRIMVEEERSQASHRSYFASLKTIHDNLSVDQIKDYPTVEHMRKRALIVCGFRSERHIVLSSKRDALLVVSMMGDIDEYAAIVQKDNVVHIYRPQSQSVAAMGKTEFEASKRAVLERCCALIGVHPGDVFHHRGREPMPQVSHQPAEPKQIEYQPHEHHPADEDF
jgi:hypothetical protein